MNHPNRQADYDTDRCQCCEWYIDCRGTCLGTDDGRPCRAFMLATNRTGDVCGETGNLMDVPAN